jgi:hypothetical protein
MGRLMSALFLSGALLCAGCDQKYEAPKPEIKAPPPPPAPVTPEPTKPTEAPKPPEPPKQTAKPEALPPDLLTIKAELTQAKGQIDLTVAKLEILAASAANFDKPGEEVVAASKALDAASEGLKKRAKDMRERGAAYFEAWEKQLASMSTPEVVARATSRKEELSKQYADVLTAMQEGRSAYDAFWTDLQATVKAVDDGLTADKVKLMAEPVAKMKAQAATVKERITTLTEKVDRIGVLYTSP